ncbi:hypothetical protein ABK040_002269 [Willaertia magna]
MNTNVKNLAFRMFRRLPNYKLNCNFLLLSSNKGGQFKYNFSSNLCVKLNRKLVKSTKSNLLEINNDKKSNLKYHVPVLVEESCSLLLGRNKNQNDKLLFLDCTFGAGGYTRTILAMYPNSRVIGIDVDYPNNPVIEKQVDAIKEEFGYNRFHIVGSNFRYLHHVICEECKLPKYSVDGIVFDLGVSSMQLDFAERGFSFQKEGLLDMRMNPLDENNPPASDLVNNMTETQLSNIIYEYGEDHNADRIARAIVDHRNNVKPFETTLELANVIEKAIPHKGFQKRKIHPATKTFQAIRIFVNDELGALQQGLNESKLVLKEGGRLVVVSYHSLEDRIVKEFIQNNNDEFERITKRIVQPTDEEVIMNRRSRSAKLRCAEKIC